MRIWAAIVIGRGSNRLSSISVLRLFDDDVQSFFDAMVTGVDPAGPRRMELRVWPNPGTEFAVGFGLVRGGRVRATVHDLAGRQVALVADQECAAGPHLLHWDGRLSSVPTGGSGVYWMKLETPEGLAVRKIVVLE